MIGKVLRTAGFEAICASSFDQAVSRVEDGTSFDIALVDVKIPHGTPHGISFARLAQTRFPSLKIIFMSSHLSSDDVKLIDEDEAFLCKPFAPHQLLELVARAGAELHTEVGGLRIFGLSLATSSQNSTPAEVC